MSIINYGPWDLDSHRVFEDFAKELGVLRRRSSGRVNTWAPSIDVHESDHEFLIKADLPGLTKDQVNVDVRDNALTISGESKQDEKRKEGNTHIQERRYGSFTRSISLPPNVKVDDITAKFENGLLELKLPKTAPTGKKINIQ